MTVCGEMKAVYTAVPAGMYRYLVTLIDVMRTAHCVTDSERAGTGAAEQRQSAKDRQAVERGADSDGEQAVTGHSS